MKKHAKQSIKLDHLISFNVLDKAGRARAKELKIELCSKMELQVTLEREICVILQKSPEVPIFPFLLLTSLLRFSMILPFSYMPHLSCFQFQQRFHTHMAVFRDLGSENLHPLNQALIDISFCLPYARKLRRINVLFLEFFGFDIQPFLIRIHHEYLTVAYLYFLLRRIA